LARLAEIQTPPQEAQKATAGESVGFAPERIRRFQDGYLGNGCRTPALRSESNGLAISMAILFAAFSGLSANGSVDSKILGLPDQSPVNLFVWTADRN